ncbi:hypothetical protein GCM10022240_15350 [Microbacterium kribbense]|uniref:Gcp-like domain-containing protein n=1 Tax=Microbacterium kribbense TaxID=433645 RepID=A0ABP7GJ96_9MICO
MILGIDTSLGTSVALIDADGVIRAQVSSADPLAHAEVIGTLLQQVIDDPEVRRGVSRASGDAFFASSTSGSDTARTSGSDSREASVSGNGRNSGSGSGVREQITHVAAGMGPGPFTGLRIGIAAARAFALGRGIPVIPVVSHDAIALERLLHDVLTDAPDAEPGRFAVATDARRREFAYSVYDGIGDDGLPIRVAGPQLAHRDALDAVLAAEGAERVDAHAVSAAMIALVAARALAAGRVVGPADALYLRSPDVVPPAPPKKVSA